MGLPRFYRPNSAGTEQLLLSQGVQKACMNAARFVESAARHTDLSGVSGKASDKAAYLAAFTSRESIVSVDMAARTKTRRGAMVVNDSELEHYFGGRSRALYKALQKLDGVVIQ